MGLAIGIDLGSTFSVISYVKNDIPEVIPNAEGDRITPSVFSLDEDNNVLVGNLAVDYESQVPDRTIRLVKRKMAQGFEDLYSFGEWTKYSPFRVSSEILKKLKRDAEDCIITVSVT
jgi:molecular chaperone DnaK (HSP70)